MSQVEVLEPVAIEGLDCVDNTILTICKYLRGEYIKLFWNSWFVRYTRNCFWGKGVTSSPRKFFGDMESFYGIKFRPLVNGKNVNVKELLQQLIDECGMVVIGIKTNCCPWQKTYREREYSIHFVIVTNLLLGGVLCTDTMPKKQKEFICWGDIERGVCEIVKIEDIWKDDCISTKRKEVDFKKIRKHVKQNIRLADLYKLVRDIQNENDLLYAIGKEKSIWRVTLYQQFYYIAGGHFQFEQFLRNKINFPGKEELINSIHSLVFDWEHLKLLTVKLHREFWNESLTREKLNEACIQYEKMLLRVIRGEKYALDIFNNGGSYSDDIMSIETGKEVLKRFICLPYNECSHMINSKDYTVACDLPLHVAIKTKSIEYSGLIKSGYNSMFCDGQEFEVNEYIGKIGFLAYATYGKQFEFVGIEYEGGQYEQYEIGLSDWIEDPLMSEDVVWKSDFYSKNSTNYVGKVVSCIISVDAERRCEKIVMPYCKDIHIFSATILRNN